MEIDFETPTTTSHSRNCDQYEGGFEEESPTVITSDSFEEDCLSDEEFEPELFNGRFKIGQKIGMGSFGDVYRAYDTFLKRYVAVKKETRESLTFQREAEVLQHLIKSKTPILHSRYLYGLFEDNQPSFIVMDLLGYNLSQLHQMCGNTFTCATLCMIAIEIINRFEELHDHGIVHRDVKPQNFLIGRTSGDQHVYICDFGLSGRYINDKGDHILFQTGIKPIGTARYASMRVHRGYERSRRDDFEALAYMLLYLNNGSLPWQGLKLRNKTHKWKLILQVKTELVIEEVCANAPYILGDFIVYSRTMRFHQRPRYSYWRKKFRETLNEVHDPNIPFTYDWEK